MFNNELCPAKLCVYVIFSGTKLGRRQVVRHWILIPAFPGSNPGAPTIHASHYLALLGVKIKITPSTYTLARLSRNFYFSLIKTKYCNALLSSKKIIQRLLLNKESFINRQIRGSFNFLSGAYTQYVRNKKLKLTK